VVIVGFLHFLFGLPFRIAPFSSDYKGALDAGMHALLLRRPDSGVDGNTNQVEQLTNVRVIKSLWDVVEWVGGRHGSKIYAS